MFITLVLNPEFMCGCFFGCSKVVTFIHSNACVDLVKCGNPSPAQIFVKKEAQLNNKTIKKPHGRQITINFAL